MRYVLGFLLLSPLGCTGFLTWRTVYSSASSDRDSVLLVQEAGCFADCSVRVVMMQGRRERVIATASDCAVTFAHSAWSGSIVAVLVDGLYCGQIKVAYDTATESKVDFESAQAWLKLSIVEAYKVTAEELEANNGDVFQWAIYPGDGQSRRSVREFRSRFRRQ